MIYAAFSKVTSRHSSTTAYAPSCNTYALVIVAGRHDMEARIFGHMTIF